MDPQKMKEAFQRLEVLDDRLTYKIRPPKGMTATPTADQVDARLRDLASYTIELKDILREFMLSFAAKPKAPPRPPEI